MDIINLVVSVWHSTTYLFAVDITTWGNSLGDAMI
jgi:hypothetical protein